MHKKRENKKWNLILQFHLILYGLDLGSSIMFLLDAFAKMEDGEDHSQVYFITGLVLFSMELLSGVFFCFYLSLYFQKYMERGFFLNNLMSHLTGVYFAAALLNMDLLILLPWKEDLSTDGLKIHGSLINQRLEIYGSPSRQFRIPCIIGVVLNFGQVVLKATFQQQFGGFSSLFLCTSLLSLLLSTCKELTLQICGKSYENSNELSCDGKTFERSKLGPSLVVTNPVAKHTV
jgi:hypothetical protein